MIVLETNVLPPIVLTGEGEGGAEGLLRVVAPTLRGVPVLGTVAPYGEATAGLGSVVALAVVLLAAYGAWRLLGRR